MCGCWRGSLGEKKVVFLGGLGVEIACHPCQSRSIDPCSAAPGSRQPGGIEDLRRRAVIKMGSTVKIRL